MAFGLTAYASRHGSRRTALDSLPAADQALPDGLSTRKDSDERFQFHFIKTSPFLELLDARDPIHLERCLAAQDAIKRGWFNTIVWGMENPAQMSKMLGALPADLGKDQGKRPGPPRSSQSSPKKIVDKKAEAMRAKVKANIQTSREVRTASRKPPGWNHKWKLEPSTRDKAESWRWFDPNGGEWRWHGPDQYHAEGHWDYNPWTSYNSPWQNVPNSQHGQ